MNEQDAHDYQNGYKARSKGLFKTACPFGVTSFRRRNAWIGGWADKDTEFKEGGKNYE